MNDFYSKKNIKLNQLKLFKVYLFLFLILFSTFQPVFALENSNLPYGTYTMNAYIDPKMYVSYNNRPQPNYEYYYIDSNNQKVATYCLDLGAKGPEDEVYNVVANSKIEDPILQGILLNGYPYKTIEELGLQTESQAKFATQFAAWIYLNNLDINRISPYTHDGIIVVEAIKRIYSLGISNMDYGIAFNTKVSECEMVTINNVTYYKRKVDIVEKKNVLSYKVSCEDENVILKEENSSYTILIPVNIVRGKYEVKLKYELNCLENSILFGQTTLPGFQNMAVAIPKTFNTLAEDVLEFDDMGSEVIITKKDATTLDILPGVEFKVLDENMNEIGRYVTNSRGVLSFKVYGKDKVYIQEVNTLNDYLIDNQVQEINLKDKKKQEITILNDKKSGRVVISKKTKEYNELSGLPENTPMANVSFYILNSKGEIVDNVTTDKYGRATTKNLEVGKYYIREYATNQYYKILDKDIEFEILDEGDEIQVNILDDNVDIPKKLPVTGR